MVNLEDLKKEAEKILEQGKVKTVFGYRKNENGPMSKPAFVKKPEDVDQLTWDPTCIHNLPRFLLDEKRKRARQKEPDKAPVALVVKGCDSRALNVMLQEKYITREDIYVIGISCEKSGVIDEKKLLTKIKGEKIEKIEFSGEDKFTVTVDGKKTEVPAEEVLARRCLECKFNFPVTYDVLLGEKVVRKAHKPFEEVERIESLSTGERWAFWKEQLDKCVRCYACRSVCPMCYCDECVADTINFAVTPQTAAEEKAQKIKWLEKSPVLSENFVYHLVRAIHLAGRCIDCGECQRVCPVDIPLRLLNKKMEKEAKELFDYEVGIDPEGPSLVSSFKDEDPEYFIR